MDSDRLVPLLLACGLASLLPALLLTWLAIRIAPRLGFVDQPGGQTHKSHRKVTPYGGGTAILLACWPALTLLLAVVCFLSNEWWTDTFGETVAVLAAGLRDKSRQAGLILAGGLILHAVGLLDDVRPLGALWKLPVILAVAALVAGLGHVRIGAFAGEAGSLALTVLWIGVIVNAFNFMDNMDGLSAGVAAIGLLFLAVCGALAGQIMVPALAALFCGAVCGFLFWNFPPAKIFMGDGGSLLVGYMLAVVSVLTTYYESGAGQPAYSLAIPLVVLAIPLYDFVTVITLRIRAGHSPLRGDQRHFSHRLVQHGLSRRFAVVTIYLAAAATGLAGTLLPGADLRRTLTIGVLVVMVLSIVAILESPPKRED